MWSQPAKAGTKVVANATIANVTAAGSLFAPVAGTNLLPFTSGAVTCSGGGLATDLNTSVTLGLLNHIVPLSPNANSLISDLNAKTGAFSGSFIPTGAKARVPFRGVVFTKNPMAIGQFKGTTGRGLAELAP